MPRTLKQVAIDIANAFTRWQLWQGGGSTTLSDLTDVKLSNLQADDVLQYDGNKWINAIMQGGGSIGAQIDTLWSGMRVANGTIQLSYDYNDYDLIVCCSRIAPTVEIQEKYDIAIKGFKSISGGAYTNGSYIASYRLKNWSSTSCEFEILNNPSGWQPTLTQIKGIKFAPIEQNLHEYSTNEKVVGTWIDGKVIYERTIEVNVIAANSQQWFTICDVFNIERVFSIICYDNNNKIITFEEGQTSGNNVQIWCNTSSAGRNIKQVVVQYTKTTD